jgi:2-phospho-L-lactate guanylyltransferase
MNHLGLRGDRFGLKSLLMAQLRGCNFVSFVFVASCLAMFLNSYRQSIVVETKMNVFAVVAVDGLGSVQNLTREKRKALTVAMLEDVLNAIKASKIRNILVVSPDSTVKQVTDKFKFSYLSPKQTASNSALKEAVEWCMKRKADSVLILPADIPLLSSGDVDKLVELGSENPSVVLSPSMNGGINALLLNPPDVIPASFGKDGFFANVKAAIDKNVPVRFHASREIMMNVDSEDDLNKLRDAKGAGSKQVFKELKLLKKTGS